MIIAFMGIDHGIGTTQIAQCTAQMLAETLSDELSANVLFLSMQSREGADYLQKPTLGTDDVRRIVHQKNYRYNNDIIEEIMKEAVIEHGVQYITGPKDYIRSYSYDTEQTKLLLASVVSLYTVTVIDCGADIDHPLAVVGAELSEYNILVTTQSIKNIHRYKMMQDVYKKIGIHISNTIVNKYRPQTGTSILTEVIGQKIQELNKISDIALKIDLEEEEATFIDIKNQKFRMQLSSIIQPVMAEYGIKLREKKFGIFT